MTLKNLLVASLATITLLTATGGGFAATGQAITDLNIREGAGSDYDIVGVLAEGEAVEIEECEYGWCRMEEGYVSAAYLDFNHEEEEDDYEDEDDYEGDWEDDYEDDYEGDYEDGWEEGDEGWEIEFEVEL